MTAEDRLAAGYQPNFDIDYEVGHQGELFVGRFVDSFQGASVEVKTDELTLTTGNVFLEYQCLRRGVWEPSGTVTLRGIAVGLNQAAFIIDNHDGTSDDPTTAPGEQHQARQQRSPTR